MFRLILGASLGIGGALAAGACGLLDDEPAPADPLDPLLATLAGLVDRYSAVIEAQPGLAERLTALRDAHQAQTTALAQLLGRPSDAITPDPSARGQAATDETAAVTSLREAEKAAQSVAQSACLAAPPERTALLGSITASCATHQEVLK